MTNKKQTIKKIIENLAFQGFNVRPKRIGSITMYRVFDIYQEIDYQLMTSKDLRILAEEQEQIRLTNLKKGLSDALKILNEVKQ